MTESFTKLTGTTLEESLLEHLEEEFDESCDFTDCSQTRTHLLCCTECPATENMCEPHANEAKHVNAGFYIIFNKTCDHRCEMVKCEKVRVRHP